MFRGRNHPLKATLTGVAQLVRDALEPGVEVRPVDINLSEWDCTLEKATLIYDFHQAR